MERLTERTADGILVKEDFGEDVLRTLYQCYGAEPMLHYANCEEGYCAMEKLAEYEDLGLEPNEIKPYIELAEKMNVCDLVRENKRLADKIRFLEAQKQI